MFIDDATGRLLALRFVPAETTEAYMEVLRGCLGRHGRPVSIYSEQHWPITNSLRILTALSGQLLAALRTEVSAREKHGFALLALHRPEKLRRPRPD